MKLKHVDWARGVVIPADSSSSMEQWFKMAYEQGVQHGRDQVAEPIIEALGLDHRYELARVEE